MNMNSVLMGVGEEGFDSVRAVGNAIVVQEVEMVSNTDDQVLVHMVMGLNGALAVVVMMMILELCTLVGVAEEDDDMTLWVVDDILLVEVDIESLEDREMAEGKACIFPLVVEVDLLAAPLMDKEVEVVFYFSVHCAVGNTQPEGTAVGATID